MFIASIFSNGEVGSDEYYDACRLNDYIDCELRIDYIQECINRLEYEKKFLEERM